MKKFISWVAAVAVIVLVYSCREAEEITTVPEVHYNVAAKIKKDSLTTKEEPASLGNPNATTDETDPKKDKIKW